MKLTLLLFLTSFFQVTVFANTSDEEITIKKDKASLEVVFREIEKQSAYRFFFNETLMKQAVPVTIDVKDVSLDRALEECFRGQPVLTYAIVEKTIIVKRREIRTTELNLGGKDWGKLSEVRGTVINDNGPIESATVLVRGTSKATSTNTIGEFVLHDVDEKAVLIVSHISHEAQEIRLNGKGLITVTLLEKVNELDEQFVVAYNTSTRKSNVGAVTLIKGEDVRDLPYRSVDKSLQGLVPGLLVTSGTGQPGSGLSNFVLRGIATGGDGSGGSTVRNPLIVIDGIPVTQDHTQWATTLSETPVINPMAQLNPSDIETITVLKDAAAIALYGSKASNGVILITTKRGRAGKTTFAIRHQTDLAKRLKGKVELLNQQEYLELLFETYRNTNPTLWTDAAILADLKKKFPTKTDGTFYSETNWEDEIFTNHATTISNEISMSGGNERSNFYLNFEYTKQNGVVKNSGFDRKSVRFNFENRPANWIKFGLNSTLSYSVQDYTALTGGVMPIGIASIFTPLSPSRGEDGNLIYNYTFPVQAANPLVAKDLNLNRNTGFRGLSKVYGEITILKDFKFTSNLGVDFTLIESKEKADPRLYDEYTRTIGVGRIQERDTRNANLITTNLIRYDKNIKNAHTINILMGQEAQLRTIKNLTATATDLQFPAYDQISNGGEISARGSNTKETLVSYFGQANYGYKEKYFISSSVRRDGSSKFGDRQRFGTYWSTGIAWVPTNEPFMRSSLSWLNYLKIRGSLGAAGNSAAINQFTRYDLLQIGTFMGDGAVYPREAGNPGIQWEQTFTWDAGLEFRMWKDRIAISGDIYNRRTNGLIYMINLPLVSGNFSVLDNIGIMENEGVEVSLSLDIIRSKNIQWKFNTNWSTNKNKLVKADVPISSVTGNLLGNEEGRNFNSFYLVRWAGVNPETGASQWLDKDDKVTTTYPGNSARKFVGKPQPDGFGAVTNTISYKSLQFSFLFYYQYGFQIYATNQLNNDGRLPYYNQDKKVLNRWQKPGDIAENPKRTLNNSAGTRVSDRYLKDGDYIRLQNLSLSYSFPKSIIEKFHLSLVKAYVQAHNVGLWTKFPGNDPGIANFQGSISLTYPNQQSFSFGLNVNF